MQKLLDLPITVNAAFSTILYSVIVPPSNVSFILSGAKALSSAPHSFADEGEMPWNFLTALVKLSCES